MEDQAGGGLRACSHSRKCARPQACPAVRPTPASKDGRKALRLRARRETEVAKSLGCSERFDQAVEKRNLGFFELSPRFFDGEKSGPIDLGELLHSARARRPFELERVGDRDEIW